MIQVQYAPDKPKLAILEFTKSNHLIFAFRRNKLIYAVDINHQLHVFTLTDLFTKLEPTEAELHVQRVKLVKPIKTLDLMRASVNDFHGVVKSLVWRQITSDYESQDEEVYQALKKKTITHFDYDSDAGHLYTVVGKVMLTWNISFLVQGVSDKMALCITQFDPFRRLFGNGNILTYNSILMTYYYRANSFKFFYQGEIVTSSLTYQQMYLFGTNEGRVF